MWRHRLLQLDLKKMSTPRQPPATCLQNDPVNSAEAQYNSVAPESQLLNLLEESHRGCKPRRVCFLSKGWVLLERYHCLIVPYYWASRWSWLLVVCRLLMSNSPGWAEIPWCCFCSQSKKLCCFLQYDASVQITLVPTKIGWHIYIYIHDTKGCKKWSKLLHCVAIILTG